MDDVARLPRNDRLDLFTASAGRRGISPIVVEKDFWVCWTLQRVFALQNPPASLVFKGGTSLSKVWGVIDRFSEDVDLSFNRDQLGFGGESDPALAASGKQRIRMLEKLVDTCISMIRDQFLPQLREAIAKALGESTQEWSLEIDADDPQAILFHYPSSSTRGASAGMGYLRPLVKLELGARNEHWPSEAATIRSFASEDFPNLFAQPHASVTVVSAERTFWEKVTILHRWHHAGPDRPLRDRQSRHYFDVYKLYQSEIGQRALANPDLLRSVAQHQEVVFAAKWANYAEAVPGTLRIIPPPELLRRLKQDYVQMREMIFGTPPTFEQIMEALLALEDAVNASTT